MRTIVQTIYVIVLRAFGALVMAAGLTTLAGVPAQLAEGLFIKVPAIVAGISCLIALVPLIPRLTPRWLTHPNTGLGGFGVSMIFVVALFIFMMTMFSSALIFGYGLESDMTRTIAIGMNFVSFGMAATLWCTTLLLSVWPDEQPPHAQIYVPPADAEPEKIDIRALRKSRTA